MNLAGVGRKSDRARRPWPIGTTATFLDDHGPETLRRQQTHSRIVHRFLILLRESHLSNVNGTLECHPAIVQS